MQQNGGHIWPAWSHQSIYTEMILTLTFKIKILQEVDPRLIKHMMALKMATGKSLMYYKYKYLQ